MHCLISLKPGLLNIAGSIGFGSAIDYVNSIGIKNIAAHEHEILEYATEEISHINGLRIIGQSDNKCSLISFVLDNVHPMMLELFLILKVLQSEQDIIVRSL